MKIYSYNANIPAACITYAGGLTAQQPIIATTRYDVEGFVAVTKTTPDANTVQGIAQETRKLEWAIKSIDVTLVRDWSVSQAMITLSCHVPNLTDPIPRLPFLGSLKGGNNQYLNCEDEIRIYAGYIDSPMTQITADMLDEHPFDLYDSSTPDFSQPNPNAANPAKPLVPIFWGFIDKMDFDANARGGMHYILSCRDRVRVFSDTKIVSIPNLAGLANVQLNQGNQTGFAAGRRDRILIDVAKAANGYQQNIAPGDEQSLCWKQILGPGEDPAVQLYSSREDSNATRHSYLEEEGTRDPSFWLRQATHKIMDIQSRPRFHMWVQRPPLVKGSAHGAPAQWQILNRQPLEIIQFLANTEERPMDFFASHVNGDYVFGPRSLDISGFSDPGRCYRTYFFRGWPKVKQDGSPIPPPVANQQILSMRVVSSTIATYNRFIVVDSSASNGVDASMLENVMLSVDSVPWSLDGTPDNPRLVRPPCRTQLIFDGALSTYGDGNADGASLITAMAAAKIWSRDLNAILITLLGDPTFYPSEAIRVYGSILHDYAIKSESGTQAAVDEREYKQENISKTYGETPPPDYNRKDYTKINQASSQLIEDVVYSGTVTTDIGQLVLPVYKVRSIKHRIITQGSSAGYTTELSAVLDA